MPEEWIYRIGGAVVLLFGSHAFWLLIMVTGFVLGFKAAQEFWGAAGQEWVGFMVALFCGLMGGVMMYFLKRAAIFVLGFACGGYLTMTLAQAVYPEPMALKIGFLIGGLVGGFCAAMVFDWAVIILSVLLGATLITETTAFPPMVQKGFFVALGIVGLAVQIFFLKSGAFRENRMDPKTE